MLGNRLGNESKRGEDQPVVIGLFPYAIDARRALNELHEHHFTSDEIVAAFRAPGNSPAEVEERSEPQGSSKWFGQLREIYRGDDGGLNRSGEARTETPATTSGFEAMLAQIDLSPQDARVLDHDAAIVTVRAGVRNLEARVLLEQRGARIVQGRYDRESPQAIEPEPATIVRSAPFTSPQQAAAPDHVQLFGEVLRVRKEKVNSGEVHVRKESITHMETVQLPVTREHLVVERSDENGCADAEHAIRVPLSEERVHVDKDTVLREEYKVGKREITRKELVTDTVRRERLLIDEASAKTSD
jgi:uncharacterized protein (TIGR02271 family)